MSHGYIIELTKPPAADGEPLKEIWYAHIPDKKRAIKAVEDSHADFFITLPLSNLPAPGTNPIDRVSRSAAEWIATSPDFARVTPEGDTLVIYRRRR